MGNEPGKFQIGDACSTCEGVIFDVEKTPKYLAVEFREIIRLCPIDPPPPNGHRFVCKLVQYCYWLAEGKIGDNLYEVWIDLAFNGDTIVKGFFWWSHDYFFESLVKHNCALEGESHLPIPGLPYYECYSGGTYKIDWGSAINEDAFNEQSAL
ncbi:unnamed protein product [marine sediment metagenome]|uniref:Uncharacterized protein n=1 Tax=marine sediment metagenome TaxID=412755 RepID=X1FPS9_9ZZZZ